MLYLPYIATNIVKMNNYPIDPNNSATCLFETPEELQMCASKLERCGALMKWSSFKGSERILSFNGFGVLQAREDRGSFVNHFNSEKAFTDWVLSRV